MCNSTVFYVRRHILLVFFILFCAKILATESYIINYACASAALQVDYADVMQTIFWTVIKHIFSRWLPWAGGEIGEM